MLCENLVIGGEDGAKREIVNIGGLLRGGNDLVQYFDIYGMSLAADGSMYRIQRAFIRERRLICDGGLFFIWRGRFRHRFRLPLLLEGMKTQLSDKK